MAGFFPAHAFWTASLVSRSARPTNRAAHGITAFVLKYRVCNPTARSNLSTSIYGMLFNLGVQPKSTPMFIAVARDDRSLPQSEAIHTHWQHAGAPSEFHIFESGGHGFGLGRPGTDSVRFPLLFEIWLKAHAFITP